MTNVQSEGEQTRDELKRQLKVYKYDMPYYRYQHKSCYLCGSDEHNKQDCQRAQEYLRLMTTGEDI